MRRLTDGFTIIEILIAIVLLSVILLIVLGSFNGMFGLSRQTTLQSTATNQAQAALEEVRGQWQDTNSYAMACIKVASAGKSPNGTSISIIDEDSSGNAISATSYKPVYVTDCSTVTTASVGATTPPSPLRRVSITGISVGTTPAQVSTLVMEIAKP